MVELRTSATFSFSCGVRLNLGFVVAAVEHFNLVIKSQSAKSRLQPAVPPNWREELICDISEKCGGGPRNWAEFAAERLDESKARRAGLIRAGPESARKAGRRVNSRGFDVSALPGAKKW